MDPRIIARIASVYGCEVCKHRTGIQSCRAFDMIPIPIQSGDAGHLEPFAGDKGITFEMEESQYKSILERIPEFGVFGGPS